MDQSKSLDLNLYEVRIDEEFLKNSSLIDTFLYECQFAIFFVDIINQDCFKLIKDLIDHIKIRTFPIFKKNISPK